MLLIAFIGNCIVTWIVLGKYLYRHSIPNNYSNIYTNKFFRWKSIYSLLIFRFHLIGVFFFSATEFRITLLHLNGVNEIQMVRLFFYFFGFDYFPRLIADWRWLPESKLNNQIWFVGFHHVGGACSMVTLAIKLIPSWQIFVCFDDILIFRFDSCVCFPNSISNLQSPREPSSWFLCNQWCEGRANINKCVNEM